jgi:hypothetical protein
MHQREPWNSVSSVKSAQFFNHLRSDCLEICFLHRINS